VADLVGGELVGPADILLAGVASLERAGPGDLSFLVSHRYLSYFQRTSAGAVLLAPDLRDARSGPVTYIVVADPAGAAVRVLRTLQREPAAAWGLHPTARIARGVRWRGRIAIGPGAVIGAGTALGADCRIGAHAILEADVTIGDHCAIGPHATVRRGVVLGNRVRLEAGACIGGPGFGFTRGETGHERIPHLGGCILEDDVEVGANTTIDRGSFDDTVVGCGTKVDNLVQIGHNVRLGTRCVVMAQVGIGGTTEIEDDAVLAGQAGLAGHLRVGQGAHIAAQSGVIGDVPAGTSVSGYPARPHRAVLRQVAALQRLAPIVDTLERLARHDGGT
jgi:UDP-3-O-[3-hydroxymyristoyl] glucosamine N-acyltransferase